MEIFEKRILIETKQLTLSQILCDCVNYSKDIFTSIINPDNTFRMEFSYKMDEEHHGKVQQKLLLGAEIEDSALTRETSFDIIPCRKYC